MNTKRKFYLELFEESEAVNFYTVHFEGEEDSEFVKFIKEHRNIMFEKDLSRITYWIDKIGLTGALERYFRPESKMNDGVNAIPIEVSKLRLYCLRISDNILILGNGGIKNVKKYNDDLHLNSCVKLLADLHRLLKFRIDQGNITIKDRTFSGNISFYTKD